MTARTANWGLIGAVALQALAVTAIWFLPWQFEPTMFREGREALSAGVFGIVIAQVSLIALWTAIGPARLPLRIAVAALGLAAVFLASFNFYWRVDGDAPIDLAVLLIFSIMLTWCQVLCVVAISGFGLKLKAVLAPTDANEPAHSQFHLWHLLVVVTAAGVLLAAARRLVTSFDIAAPVEFPSMWVWLMLILLIMVTFGVVSSVLAIATRLSPIWPVRITIAGLAVICLYSLLLERLLIWLVDRPSASTVDHVTTNLAAYGWTSLSLWVLTLGRRIFQRASAD